MTEPCDLSATEARALIGSGALSPVELMDSCIARIEAVDGAVNAMVARDFDGARAAAREAEAAVRRGATLGPLHGLPTGIKDMNDVAGLPTTYGSLIYKDNVPAADDALVAGLRGAGAIPVGKTNNPEWSAGANTHNAVYGATGNPFDTSKTAAGSSGGSGAALACGMVVLASGSDMGGSLRNPAAYCGVVGFRASAGLVPTANRAMGWLPLSISGPMGRTVDDVALMLQVMATPDARDPANPTVPGAPAAPGAAFAKLRPLDLSALRVALSPDLGFAPTEALVARAFGEKTGLFRGGFARADDDAPDCSGTDRAFGVLRAVSFLGHHRRHREATPHLVGPNVAANVVEGLSYSALDVADALETQSTIYRRWQAFFAEYDVLLAPAVTVSPRPWRELYPVEIDGKPTQTYFHWLALAYAATLVGHPALSLPVGLDDNGMPFGLQIIGPRGGDELVLRVARALEAHLAGDVRTARPVPDIAALAAAPPLSASEGFFTAV